MKVDCIFYCFLFGVLFVDADPPRISDDDRLHVQAMKKRNKRIVTYKNKAENSGAFWYRQAQFALKERLQNNINKNIAKNVILFLGDGMSITTLAATRAYLSQQKGHFGEESVLSFEEFPFTGLSKTYCVDSQVADSACTATAYFSGAKSNIGTLGVSGNVELGDWKQSINVSNHFTSIGDWSQCKDKRTGIVTTTRVTHASPAGLYAHTADRHWESDFDLIGEDVNPSIVDDIAKQLVRGPVGSKLHVILGGGRKKLLPIEIIDNEGQKGERLDGQNLIEEWMMSKKSFNPKYVWHRDQLLNVSQDTDYLLGLFESSHCKYNLEKTKADPTLEEMTEAAIKVLSQKGNGYFLFVEGGRIDHAHHATSAMKALDETVQFSNAVRRAREMTNEEDTLIVVTADHAHTMSISGYADRENDILGAAGIADDGKPYSTLSYANGPGYRKETENGRHDISNDNTHDSQYMFPALVPLKYETHGGDDVAIFALGPWSHLFSGVMEQHVIPHLMAYASCVGNAATMCDDRI